jgi:ABC-type phosphate transport system substrate-binding protein
MKKTVMLLAAALALLLAPLATFAEDLPVQVIVNDSSSVSSLSKDEVSRLFLKKVTRWDNGTPVLPVDLPAASRVRADFSDKLLGKSTAAVDALWRQKIFSGAAVPPIEKGSEEDVIAYVRATPGAIGYVSKAAALSGVKAVTIR